MKIINTICPNCSVGCGVGLIVKDGKVLGIYPNKRHPINEGKNCLNGRTCHKIINHEKRLKNPLIKKNGAFVEVSWEEALNYIASHLKKYNGDEITFIASGKCTNEDNYALKKLADGLKAKIGHCICNSPKVDYAEVSISGDIEEAKNIVIIGDVFSEHALIGRKVIKARDKGARITIFNTEEREILKLNADKFIKVDSYLDIDLNDFKDDLIIINAPIDTDKFKNNKFKNFKILPVAKHCNTVGATLLNIPALNREEYFNLLKDSEFLYIVGENPALVNKDILKDVDFLVVQDVIFTETADLADVVLPTRCWAEKDGTFTNFEKKIQHIKKAADPQHKALEDWKIIKKLAEKLNINLGFESFDELHKEVMSYLKDLN